MNTSILDHPLSPTQERGTSSNDGKILYEKITNALGEEVNVRIKYTLVADSIVADLMYHTYGNDSIPANFLREIAQELVEQTEGHTLIFD